MTEKLHVVIHQTTNHILASATGPGEAGTQPDLESLYGESLLLREPVSGDTHITVDAEYLTSKDVDFREDILFTPTRFVIVDSLPEHKDEFGNDGTVLALTRTDITITLPAITPDPLTFWLQLESDQLTDPITRVINVQKDQNSATESEVLPPGDYRVLMLGPDSRATILGMNVA